MTITKSKLEKTSTPMPILIGEARLIHVWCQDDKSVLVAAGLDWKIAESLPLLCDNSESLSIQCKIEMISLSRFRKKLQQEFKAASLSRSKIAERIRYALYIAESNQKIPVYHRRKVNSEIIQDLLSLEALCCYFSDILTRTGFDQAQSESLKQLALQLQARRSHFVAHRSKCMAL